MPAPAARLATALATVAATAGLSLAAPLAPAAAATSATPGQRIVTVAKRWVGARYRFGGATPQQGFDCSGFTEFVYDRADVARLPHDANGQRFVRHMHRETRRQARPGDLIFYFHGSGPAYHVAIYAGRGYQYAAATPGDGVRYQRIWSRDIGFRTDWH